MQHFVLLIFIAGLVPGTRAQSSNFEIVVGERFGPIRETTTRAQLVSLFGRGQVIDRPVSIGEDLCTPGTVVFANTNNEIEIGWQDNARTRVAFVRAIKQGGAWRTRRGVRVGTSLRELESIAGKTLTFLGFEWDYGGGMAWTEDGKSLRLEVDPDEESAALVSGDISGDREVRSDHPVIRKMKIYVTWMRQDWGRPFDETICP